ncbi:hypothetical protein BROUX41_000860 [Berkeleyomyces rouxiae]|uniref:uncharacterized protein n=1 Tax=Berkeleyomyces rouxiae TaxID=2035830 RepID=UPI003B800DB9
MSNLFSGINARLRGGNSSNKAPAPSKSPSPSSTQHSPSTSTTPSLQVNTVASGNQGTGPTPRIPPLISSPSLTQTIRIDDASMGSTADEILASYHLPKPMPLWLNNAYSKHIVKGNFMTLSARPKTVEQGEWVAHQVVEHYRNLWHFVRVIHEKEDDGQIICNAVTCPRMSAGPNHSFTWLNAKREPVELPAHEYMMLMQRWISGKVDDDKVFPTDPAGVSFAVNANITTSIMAQLANPSERDYIGKRSGFPDSFIEVCQMVFRQMFRVYAHLYFAHYVEPFYHLNLEKQLNSCFSHFLLTATALDMLKQHELEPMQALIDLWAANGTFPPESRVYEYANLKAGERLMQLSNNT